MALTINSLSLLTTADKNVLQNIFIAVQTELERMQQEIDALKNTKVQR